MRRNSFPMSGKAASHGCYDARVVEMKATSPAIYTSDRAVSKP